MTYDILFQRVRPGHTLDETLAELNAAYDPGAEPEPMTLTADQRAVWERIVGRTAREVGPVTTEEYLYCLTLDRVGPVGRVQLDYDGDSAALSIAYRHSGPDALSIMTEAYRIGRVVVEESGFEGYDYEVDQSVLTGDVEVAAAKLDGTSNWAQSTLTG
ncbi:hypothetical protein [Saccharothrix sp. NRRL B-16314]|uniref:hypothetical protein n=1 Tax=Saccharothrix sp. NRRL B-16314 TaxID=1463825 RepID=UPI0005242616|nr:hypothetical protein [Saccharothrix sp. NRRL B-16314]